MTLELDDNGFVFHRDAEGDRIDLGPVSDDWRCPDGMEAAWADLFDRWTEETEEGQVELQMLRLEYEASFGGYWA